MLDVEYGVEIDKENLSVQIDFAKHGYHLVMCMGLDDFRDFVGVMLTNFDNLARHKIAMLTDKIDVDNELIAKVQNRIVSATQEIQQLKRLTYRGS